MGRGLLRGLAPLQEALSHLQAMGAVAKLPEDAQWSIRALLMRRLPQAALPRAAAPPPAGADAALPQLLGYLLQQMSKVGPPAHCPPVHARLAMPCCRSICIISRASRQPDPVVLTAIGRSRGPCICMRHDC